MSQVDFITISQNAQIGGGIFLVVTLAFLIYVVAKSDPKPRHKTSKQ